MAAITGVKGKVTLVETTHGGQALLINKWNAKFDRELLEITSFDDQDNERSYLGGLLHLIGTCEGTADDAATPFLAQMKTEDSTGTPAFQLDLVSGSRFYKFTAIISNMTVEVPKSGVSTFSLGFESSGEVTVDS